MQHTSLNETLLDSIKTQIIKQSFLPFDLFMQLALYDPEHGYYSSCAPKFSAQGDFVTAPEISPLFARSIAQQFKEILQNYPNGGEILEIGAGSGAFCETTLQELNQLNALPQKYYIYEISPALRALQKTKLSNLPPDLFARICWIDSLDAIQISGVIFANEWLDALPIKCFAIWQNQIYERVVILKDDKLSWDNIEPDADLHAAIFQLQTNYQLPQNYSSEINLNYGQWFKTFKKLLNSGVILFFDYGYNASEYYTAERNSGTLTCFHKHTANYDPFINVGRQDITAHVNFTAVGEAASKADFEVCGFTTQFGFLFSCGLMNLIVPHQDALQNHQQNNAIKTLTMPGQMGEIIKVIALAKNYAKPLLGFREFMDRYHL